MLTNLYETQLGLYKNEPPVPINAMQTNPAQLCIEKARQYFCTSGRVEEKLEESFQGRDMRVPPEAVFELSLGLGLGNSDEKDVCDALAGKLQVVLNRVRATAPPGEAKIDAQRRRERAGRLEKGVLSLRYPAPSLLSGLSQCRRAVKIKERATQLLMLPPEQPAVQAPQHQLALPPPPGQQGGVVALPLPALPPPAPAQAVLTTDTQISTFLGQHIRRREDCARCVVACTDPTARTSFGDASEVGNGRTRDMGRSLACPLAAHGVTKRQMTELLDPVTSLRYMAKRAKVAQFMQDAHGVTPLGKEEGVKSYLVSLYNQDDDGQYEVAGRQTEFYQGFRLV
jgi:hypothetical protein